ncbi:MAG TPA: hypothetical protein VN739_06495, partial [Nitrososphaerales archaeon]|nr:hypothetical protein [Nitrososphaerales archaeon]
FCVSTHASTFWPKSYVQALFNPFSSFRALLSLQSSKRDLWLRLKLAAHFRLMQQEIVLH